MELIGVREGVLDRDRREQREVIVRVAGLERNGVQHATAGPPSVAGAVHGDREQPRLGRLRVAQTVVRAHRPDERLLEKILGVGPVAAQLDAVAVEPVEVLADDVGERPLRRDARRPGRTLSGLEHRRGHLLEPVEWPRGHLIQG